MSQKIVFIFSRSPLENSNIVDAFDAAMTAAIFDQKVSLIFIESCWNAFLENSNVNADRNKIAEKLKTLAALTDIRPLILQSENITKTTKKREGNTLMNFLFLAAPDVKKINASELQQVLKTSDKVLSF